MLCVGRSVLVVDVEELASHSKSFQKSLFYFFFLLSNPRRSFATWERDKTSFRIMNGGMRSDENYLNFWCSLALVRSYLFANKDSFPPSELLSFVLVAAQVTTLPNPPHTRQKCQQQRTQHISCRFTNESQLDSTKCQRKFSFLFHLFRTSSPCAIHSRGRKMKKVNEWGGGEIWR